MLHINDGYQVYKIADINKANSETQFNLYMQDISQEHYINQHEFDQENQVFQDHQTVQKFPYSCVGLLIYRHQIGSKLIGTAFLISSDLIMTVAHNAWDREQKRFFNNHLFYPGVSGALQGVQPIRITSIRFPQEYKTCPNKDTIFHDYALMKLEKSIKNRQQYIQLGLDYKTQDQQVGIVGYRANSTNAHFSLQAAIWKAGTHLVTADSFEFGISSYGGNSGAPILVRRAGKEIAISMHKGGSSLGKVNKGILFNDAFITNILAWDQTMNSSIKFGPAGSKTSNFQNQNVESWINNRGKKSKINVYNQLTEKAYRSKESEQIIKKNEDLIQQLKQKDSLIQQLQRLLYEKGITFPENIETTNKSHSKSALTKRQEILQPIIPISEALKEVVNNERMKIDDQREISPYCQSSLEARKQLQNEPIQHTTPSKIIIEKNFVQIVSALSKIPVAEKQNIHSLKLLQTQVKI